EEVSLLIFSRSAGSISGDVKAGSDCGPQRAVRIDGRVLNLDLVVFERHRLGWPSIYCAAAGDARDNDRAKRHLVIIRYGGGRGLYEKNSTRKVTASRGIENQMGGSLVYKLRHREVGEDRPAYST